MRVVLNPPWRDPMLVHDSGLIRSLCSSGFRGADRLHLSLHRRELEEVMTGGKHVLADTDADIASLRSWRWVRAIRIMSAPSVVWICRFILLVTAIPMVSSLLRAQAAVEYGRASSKSGATAASAPRVAPPADTTNAAMTHLPARSGPAAEEVNRRALENHAGKDAAKLMLRSTPSKGSVRINGKVVGKTLCFWLLLPGSTKSRWTASAWHLPKSKLTCCRTKPGTFRFHWNHVIPRAYN